MAIGSCNEVEVLLDYVLDFEYMSKEEHKKFLINMHNWENSWMYYIENGSDIRHLTSDF